MAFTFITNQQLKSNAAKGAKYALHKVMRGWKPGRSHINVHASETTKPGFCIRKYALLDVVPHEVPNEFLDTSLTLTFDIGKMVQDYVINRLSDTNSAVTNWVCMACNWRYDRCKRPEKCTQCSCKVFKPDEIRLKSSVSDISGGFDVFLHLEEPLLRICEIKTMAPEEFGKLVAPLAEHRLRTNLYMRLAAESDDPWKDRVNLQQANILYISKGGFGKMDPLPATWGINDKFSPFKEFVIQRDDAQTDKLTAQSVRLKASRDKIKGMPAGICPTAMVKTAQDCLMLGPCFSGQYPVQEELLDAVA